ncbi:unnamed protein product [Schistosoma turkestanicum]|nr:unnamed protein product [Schistosoma turkestanicum]
MNITTVQNYMRVDYGPLCTLNRYSFCAHFKYSVYLMGDCNVTSVINYTYPIFVNISGSSKNFSVDNMTIVVLPSFPNYTQILVQSKSNNVAMQPGEKRIIPIDYIFPLNSNYSNSSIKIIGTDINSSNESVISIINFNLSLGSNLASITNDYSFNYSSIYQTNRIDQLIIYFKNIRNTGTSSVPLMRNTLSLSVEIQLSDSKSVENGTIWPLIFTGQFNNVKNLTKIFVTCLRNGLEKPSINVIPSQLSSFTLTDCPDRDQVYLQIIVHMMSGTGLECERQSIILYFSPQIKSISVVNQTGTKNNLTLKTPLHPISKSVQFQTGSLYFGTNYTVIFSLKYYSTIIRSIVKFPVLIEIVCKPIERGSAVVNTCSQPKFFKFRSRIHVALDYTYPCHLPHFTAMKHSVVQLPNRQTNTFLNVGDYLFYCGQAFNRKSSLVLDRRCFMINKLPDRIWYDMGPSVEQIIAYTNPSGLLFGMGANGGGVLMSKNFGKTWHTVNPFLYKRNLNTPTEIITADIVPWILVTGTIDSALMESFCKLQVAERWNVCINAIYANEFLLANWTYTCPNIQRLF